MAYLVLVFLVSQVQAQYGRGNQDQRCFDRTSATQFLVKQTSFKAGDDIRSNPLILPDGTVVVSSTDRHIYFVNPDGSLKSKFDTTGGNLASAALGKDGSVVVGSGDGHLYFFKQDGTPIKSVELGGSLFSSPAITPSGEIVLGSGRGMIHFLDPDGMKKAEFKVQPLHPVTNSPVVLKDGTVAIASGSKMYFFTEMGALKLAADIPGPAGLARTAAVKEDGTLVFGSTNGNIYFMDEEGNILVNRPVGTNDFGVPLILPDGKIVVSTVDHNLHLLAADGSEIKSYQTPLARFPGTAQVLNSNFIVSGSNDNILHILDLNLVDIQNLGPLGETEAGQAYLTAPIIANDGTIIIASASGDLKFISTDPGAKQKLCH